MNLCSRGRKEAGRRGGEGCGSVRYGERTVVCSSRHRCLRTTPNPTRPSEEQGGVASQELDLSVVAVVRPQGTASTLRELFRRRL